MAWLSPDLQCLSQAAKHGSAVLSKLSKGRLTHTEGRRGVHHVRVDYLRALFTARVLASPELARKGSRVCGPS